MIVVDANVISYLYLNSNCSSLAEKVFQKDPEWCVPILWRSEFRSVLSFYVRREIISLSEAVEIYETAEALLSHNEYEVSSIQVLHLSQMSGCSAYDCEFVNLAKDLHVTLVTEDKKVLDNFPELAATMAQFLEKE